MACQNGWTGTHIKESSRNLSRPELSLLRACLFCKERSRAFARRHCCKFFPIFCQPAVFRFRAAIWHQPTVQYIIYNWTICRTDGLRLCTHVLREYENICLQYMPWKRPKSAEQPGALPSKALQWTWAHLKCCTTSCHVAICYDIVYRALRLYPAGKLMSAMLGAALGSCISPYNNENHWNQVMRKERTTALTGVRISMNQKASKSTSLDIELMSIRLSSSPVAAIENLGCTISQEFNYNGLILRPPETNQKVPAVENFRWILGMSGSPYWEPNTQHIDS